MEHANSIWGRGRKSNLQINFRTRNFTYLFRAGLKVIDHYEHPDDADEDDQFDVATHVALSLSLSIPFSLSLVSLDSNCYGRFPCGYCNFVFDLAISIDDVVFHCVKQKAFIHSLIALKDNHSHTHSHRHTHT